VNNLGKEKIASKFSSIITNIFQKQNVKISLFWKNGYDISVKSVSDNLTEGTIPLQEDSKTDQTTLKDMETPTATPSLVEGPRMSKRNKKSPTTKSKDYFMVNNNVNLDSRYLDLRWTR
jgi:hypothetical protein